MKILAGVRSDLSENRKMSKGQGFLGTINQPRVSQRLSHILTEYDDGQNVNIHSLIIFNVLELLSDKWNTERYREREINGL